MQQLLEVLTLYLPYLLTRGDMQNWWQLNNYTWNEHVGRENAQEAEFRELYADMAHDGWFSGWCSSRSFVSSVFRTHCVSSMLRTVGV